MKKIIKGEITQERMIAAQLLLSKLFADTKTKRTKVLIDNNGKKMSISLSKFLAQNVIVMIEQNAFQRTSYGFMLTSDEKEFRIEELGRGDNKNENN